MHKGENFLFFWLLNLESIYWLIKSRFSFSFDWNQSAQSSVHMLLFHSDISSALTVDLVTIQATCDANRHHVSRSLWAAPRILGSLGETSDAPWRRLGPETQTWLQLIHKGPQCVLRVFSCLESGHEMSQTHRQLIWLGMFGAARERGIHSCSDSVCVWDKLAKILFFFSKCPCYQKNLHLWLFSFQELL